MCNYVTMPQKGSPTAGMAMQKAPANGAAHTAMLPHNVR